MQPDWAKSQVIAGGGGAAGGYDVPRQTPTLTALMNRLAVALNCADDECRTMLRVVVHGPGPPPATNNMPEPLESEPPHLLARLEACVERAEILNKSLAHLREHI